MSKVIIAQFDKEVQKRMDQLERFKKNLSALHSVPRALESYIAFFTPRNFKPNFQVILSRIENMEHDFVVEDGTISFKSEFSGATWTFDPSRKPLGWRTVGDGELAGVIRT